MINNLLIKYILLSHQPGSNSGGGTGKIGFLILVGYHIISKAVEYRKRNAMESRVKQLEEQVKQLGPVKEDVITQTEIDRLRESGNVSDMQGLDDAFAPITPGKSYSVEEDADTIITLIDKWRLWGNNNKLSGNPVSDYFDFWYNLYINSDPVVLFNTWGSILIIYCLINIGLVYLGSYIINNYADSLSTKYPTLIRFLEYRNSVSRYIIKFELLFIILATFLLIILNVLEYTLI